MRADAPLQVDVDVLLAREAQQFLDAFFASDPGLLVAAEWRAEEVLRHLVDPHVARLDRRRHAVRGGEVVGPDRTGEPVLDLVNLRQHHILRAPFEDGENRAEDLLLADAHVHGHVGEYGGLDVEALGEMGIGRRFAAGDESGAILLAGVDVAEHAIILCLAHNRAHGRGWIGRDAGLVALDRMLHPFEHGVVDLLVHESAAGRAAGLPAPGEVHAVDDGGRHRVEIGVGESDQRILPPSSSVTGLSVSAAAFITARPVGTLPMSATLATSGWLASTWPTSFPPGTRFHTPGGRMPSINSASRSEDSGACSGGLTTTVLPAASGAADFPATNMKG